jgi:CelD/BcsL family acetyltransferase involved in cellulose biosynthesis
MQWLRVHSEFPVWHPTKCLDGESMQLDVIRTIEELDALKEEWNALLGCSASHVPFLRHEYLSAWWRTLGGGEWESGELYVVIARTPGGKLEAIAPLFLTQNKDKDGELVMMLLGSIEISDYLDVVICPQGLPAFIGALFEHLDDPAAPPWKVLDFYNLLESSPTLPVLESTARQHGWLYEQERLQHCPYISLPGDWDTYLASLDKKQRHELRRKMRRAESNDEPLRWYTVADEASLEENIEAFLGLMEQDPEKKTFLTEPMRVQMRLTMQAAYQGGWLQLAFLEVGGVKAAAYLNFDDGGHIWVYNSGLDYRFSDLSPGWVLLGHLLEWANENKRLAFDFMRGDEEYKYRFGALDRFIVRATIRR